jgi:hypothetical protein
MLTFIRNMQAELAAAQRSPQLYSAVALLTAPNTPGLMLHVEYTK